jgi:succinate-semialdehyde dehydrogenase/glutarate-semialdehyde dehydrogenase
MAALRFCDTIEDATQIGPNARADLVKTLSEQVDDAVAKGARVLTGGAPLGGPGNYYPPTVLVGVPPTARAYREELFGPVATVFRVNDIDAAIDLANDTKYGLGSSVWTTDPAERERFAASLDAGQVFVNAMVASDPRVPFGGVKNSGYGRELGAYGIRAFTNVKTVWVA